MRGPIHSCRHHAGRLPSVVGRAGLRGQTRWTGTLPLPRAPRGTYCGGRGFLTWTVRRRTIGPPWKGCHKKTSYKTAEPVGRTRHAARMQLLTGHLLCSTRSGRHPQRASGRSFIPPLCHTQHWILRCELCPWRRPLRDRPQPTRAGNVRGCYGEALSTRKAGPGCPPPTHKRLGSTSVL